MASLLLTWCRSLRIKKQMLPLGHVGPIAKWSTSGMTSISAAQDNMQGDEQPDENVPMDVDMPVWDMYNPYQKDYRRCIFCIHDIEPDYKNIQLLSQFVSSHTGRIHGRHITGLCIPQQKRIAKLIKRARRFGLMPYMNKDLKFLQDPKLFDPFRPNRPERR